MSLINYLNKYHGYSYRDIDIDGKQLLGDLINYTKIYLGMLNDEKEIIYAV